MLLLAIWLFEPRASKTDEVIERITLNAKAHQKPSTWKPGTSQAAIKTIKALITKRKMPNEKTVIGKVRKIKRGLTKRFKTERTREMMIAAGTPLT